jgi:hypothetical protein
VFLTGRRGRRPLHGAFFVPKRDEKTAFLCVVRGLLYSMEIQIFKKLLKKVDTEAQS